MSRVITFSRVYPSYHPKAGQPTFFDYKVARSIWDQKLFTDDDLYKYRDFPALVAYGHEPKHHTIRAGHRWKEGDWFSPRVWSGKPYASKQITFAPDIQIKKVYSFSIGLAAIYIDQQRWIDKSFIAKVAANEGLELKNFLDWFNYPKPFSGQIICWSESINYVRS